MQLFSALPTRYDLDLWYINKEIDLLSLSLPGCVCLISITFSNILIHRRKIQENIVLFSFSVLITWLWIMVNKVRQDILEEVIRRRQNTEMELIQIEESMQNVSQYTLSEKEEN